MHTHPQGALRIAHCGGFHSPQLNQLVAALNALAALFGHPLQWDAETLGCDPSMSSIPAGDQRCVGLPCTRLSRARLCIDLRVQAHPSYVHACFGLHTKDTMCSTLHVYCVCVCCYEGSWLLCAP